MPSQEEMRKERFVEILRCFQGKQIETIDPILCQIRILYPWLREFTVKEYAVGVARMLAAKQKEIEVGEGL